MFNTTIAALKFWNPAVHPNAASYLATNSWVCHDSLVRYPYYPAIYIRVGAIFLAALPLLRWLCQSYWSSIGCAFCVVYGAPQLECWRAVRALREIARQNFYQNEVVPSGTMGYMIRDLKLVEEIVQNQANHQKSCQAAELIDEPPVLLERALINTSLFHRNVDTPWLDVFKFLVKSFPFSKNDFFHLLRGASAHAIYLLEQNKIDPSQWTFDEQEFLWKEVPDERLMKELVKHGFDPNIRAGNRSLALSRLADVHWRSTSKINLEKLCLFFSQGVTVPQPDEVVYRWVEISQSDPKNNTRQTVMQPFTIESVHHSDVLAILEQAKIKKTFDISETEAQLFTITPLVDIDLCENRFQIAKLILMTRGVIVAITAFVFAQPMVAVGLLLTYCYVEWYRAKCHLNELALKALQQPFPPRAVYAYLAQNAHLMDKVRPEDKNKFDDHGKKLRDYIPVDLFRN
jgi:hypothetical protein